MTAGLLISSSTKFTLLKISKLSGNLEDYHKYRNYLNVFTKVKKLSKDNYYTEKAALYSSDKSKTWQLKDKREKLCLRVNSLSHANIRCCRLQIIAYVIVIALSDNFHTHRSAKC